MRDDVKGSPESKSAALSLFAHSLDYYIDEVIASNQNATTPNVPKQVKDSVHTTLQSSIDYYDYMIEETQKIGDTAYLTYHKLKADSYRALKTN